MSSPPTKVDTSGAVVEVRDESSKIIRKFLFDIERRMKISLTGPKSGRIYRRAGKQYVTKKGDIKRRKPTFHRASAPGEAPATDTGFLMNGIRARMDSPIQGTITIAAPYAIWLEAGTRFMEPRPFIAPAIEGALERLGNTVTSLSIRDLRS